MHATSTAWCAFVLLVCAIAPGPQQKAQPSQKETSRELQRLYDADHQDQDDWSDANEAEFGRRQTERRDRVLEILAGGMLGPVEDWYNASWLLQHGDTPEDYGLAHALSVPPMLADLALGGFACAATLDRFLESIERTEVFSTQTYTPEPYPAKPFGAYAAMPDSIRRVFALAPVEPGGKKPAKGRAKELAKLRKQAEEPLATGAPSAEAPAWLARAREIVASGAPDSDEDYFTAAEILLRSSEASDLLMSHVCAIAAAKYGHSRGLRLSAEAFDHFLLAVKRPQIFGTVPGPDGKPLEPRRLAPEVIRKGYGLVAAAERKGSR